MAKKWDFAVGLWPQGRQKSLKISIGMDNW
jgi:hypothetical protein